MKATAVIGAWRFAFLLRRRQGWVERVFAVARWRGRWMGWGALVARDAKNPPGLELDVRGPLESDATGLVTEGARLHDNYRAQGP